MNILNDSRFISVNSFCFDCSIRLKTCEPEFLIATPERLLVLVSLKAIDISSVSMLVSKCGIGVRALMNYINVIVTMNLVFYVIARCKL